MQKKGKISKIIKQAVSWIVLAALTERRKGTGEYDCHLWSLMVIWLSLVGFAEI